MQAIPYSKTCFTGRLRRHFGWYVLMSIGVHLALLCWLSWRWETSVDRRIPITLLTEPFPAGSATTFPALSASAPAPPLPSPVVTAPGLSVALVSEETQMVSPGVVLSPTSPPLPVRERQKQPSTVTETLRPPARRRAAPTRPVAATVVPEAVHQKVQPSKKPQVKPAPAPSSPPITAVRQEALPAVPEQPSLPSVTRASSATGAPVTMPVAAQAATAASAMSALARPPQATSSASLEGQSAAGARGQEAGPTAPHFVRQTKPQYPLMARRRGVEGMVTLSIEMLADGSVGEVKIAQSSGSPLLDKAARQAVKQWTHAPATHQGQPVTRWANLDIHFTLDQEAR